VTFSRTRTILQVITRRADERRS